MVVKKNIIWQYTQSFNIARSNERQWQVRTDIVFGVW